VHRKKKNIKLQEGRQITEQADPGYHSTATTLRGEEPTNPSSVHGRSKRIFSSPMRPDRIWGPPSSFAGGKTRGAIPSTVEIKNEWRYTSTPSWRGPEQSCPLPIQKWKEYLESSI
jgi:hypothetical protein